jgi:NADH-quinone oxidoreductase subunit G
MPKLTINGRELEVPQGVNLIQAAESVGIEIPHYCYHPGLSIVGNCRMCLVELERTPKLQIACNTKVADGMVVHTESPRVKVAQAAVLEFLLINHPIDCPVCDQAGECKLQDYYMDYDRKPSRFPLGKKNRKGKALDIGSGVMLDQERCILCARCTRFFEEITHTSELAIFERADHCFVDTYPGRKVNNRYACNVVDICPVGALTEKDFRFRMRVWYLHRTPSVCGACARGCAIDIDHHHGRIYRYKPRYNPNINKWWMCDEGRHSFPAIQGEHRLIQPLVQEAQRFAVETWEAAIARAAQQIRRCSQDHGPNAVGALVGAQATNEEIFALKRFMSRTIGSINIGAISFSPFDASPGDDFLIRADKNPNTRGLQAMGLPLDGLARLAFAAAQGELKLLITLRADPARVLGRAEFVRAMGALEHLIVLDTGGNQTASFASQVLPIAAYPELDGSFTNFEGWVQRLYRAFEPPGQSHAALEVIGALEKALDGVEDDYSASAVFADMARAEAAFCGLSLEGLGNHGARLNGLAAHAQRSLSACEPLQQPT